MEERGVYKAAGPIGKRTAGQECEVDVGRPEAVDFRRDNSGLSGQLGKLAAVLRAGIAGSPSCALRKSWLAAVMATGATLSGTAATGAAGRSCPQGHQFLKRWRLQRQQQDRRDERVPTTTEQTRCGDVPWDGDQNKCLSPGETPPGTDLPNVDGLRLGERARRRTLLENVIHSSCVQSAACYDRPGANLSGRRQ